MIVGTMCFDDEVIVGTWKPFTTSFARSVPAKPTLPDALMSLIVTSLGDGRDCPVFPTSGNGPPVFRELKRARAAVGSGTTYETRLMVLGTPGYWRKSTFFCSKLRPLAI